MSTEDEAYSLVSDLKNIGRKYSCIKNDGHSLFCAILSCINVPPGFTVPIFRKQIVAYALRNFDFFGRKLSLNESFESFCRNLAGGLSYGNKNSLYLISLMWNVSISVLDPYNEEVKILHNIPLADVDIVLACNGFSHFSGSYFIQNPHVRLSPRKFRVTKKKNLPDEFSGKPVQIKTEKKEDEDTVMIPDECDKPDRDEKKFGTSDKDEKKIDTPDKDKKIDTPDKDKKLTHPTKTKKLIHPTKTGRQTNKDM